MATIRRAKPSHLDTGLFKVIGGSTNDSIANVSIHTNATGSGYVDEVVIQLVGCTGSTIVGIDIANATTSATLYTIDWQVANTQAAPYSGGTIVSYSGSDTIKIHLEENQLLRFDCPNLSTPDALYLSMYVNRIQNPA